MKAARRATLDDGVAVGGGVAEVTRHALSMVQDEGRVVLSVMRTGREMSWRSR
jgi:hypothetical protein